MKTKNFIFTALLLSTIISCIKYDIKATDSVSENTKAVFGVNFDPTQDWCTTVSGEVTIKVDVPLTGEILVKVLVYTDLGDEEENYTLREINQTTCQRGGTVTLKYDIPGKNNGMFVICADTQGNYYVKGFEPGEIVSFATSTHTRAITTRADIPGNDNLVVTGNSVSYETKRGYPGFENETLWQGTEQGFSVGNYSQDFIAAFRAIVNTYLPNGRKYNNLPQIKESGYWNEDCYAITTGKEPIIVSPVYKNDGGYHEIEVCDLYYYYFKEEDLGEDPVGYIKSLPKYRAFSLGPVLKGDNVIEKHIAYALPYWGDETPIIGETCGTYQFPEGYKIGFMLQSNFSSDVKKGELYFDGRLNNDINRHGHFASSKLGDGDPRMAWLTVNQKMMLCCEGGTDADYNDVIFEISGGIKPIIVIPEVDHNYYTFCYEDQRLGDYDMNDVVLRGARLDETHIEYTLLACGAYDELYIHGINGKVINQNAEVHSIFGKSQSEFINTVGSPVPVILDTVTVNKSFSFLTTDTQPYIYDKTRGYTVKVSTKGEDPHAIMIPYKFQWPTEKTCIAQAYDRFNSWGMAGSVTDNDWYKYPTEGKVYGF